MKFTSARRHDSKNFLYAIDDFGRNGFGISPKNICLDSAHDNIPTYELLEHWDINALIDINGRAKSSENAPNDITFNKDGYPLCRAGHKMCSWGNDPVKDAHKYRCPLKCKRIDTCPYEKECSPGSYGRTVYIKNNNDLETEDVNSHSGHKSHPSVAVLTPAAVNVTPVDASMTVLWRGVSRLPFQGKTTRRVKAERTWKVFQGF